MEIERLLKENKCNNINFGNHKEDLKNLLLNRDYFTKEKEYWDWRLTFSSLSFSLIIMMFSFAVPLFNNDSMVDSLERNTNVNNLGSVEWAGQDVKVYEMVEQKTKTLFYFDTRNDVLVHSEINNN